MEILPDRSVRILWLKNSCHEDTKFVSTFLTHPLGPPLLKIEGDDHPTHVPFSGQEKGPGDDFGWEEGESLTKDITQYYKSLIRKNPLNPRHPCSIGKGDPDLAK